MRKKLLILAFTCSVVGADLVYTAELEAQDRPRTTMYVIKYLGEQKGYEDFQTILGHRIKSIKGDLGKTKGFEYISDLQIRPATTPDDFEKLWRKSGALTLLYGSMQPRRDKIFVKCEAYLYDLKGSLSNDPIVLEQLYSITDFRLTRDTYALLTLYALAMDAKRTKSEPYIVTRYLTWAAEISRDIHPKDKDDQVALLIRAIQSELKSLKDKRQSQ